MLSSTEFTDNILHSTVLVGIEIGNENILLINAINSHEGHRCECSCKVHLFMMFGSVQNCYLLTASLRKVTATS